MNLNEQIYRIQEMMGLLNEEKKSYENKPIILIGPQGTGKSTTSKALSKNLKYHISQPICQWWIKHMKNFVKPNQELK